MNAVTGTGALLRLALRLDRVRLPVWVLLIGVLPTGTAAQYAQLYPTVESRAPVAVVAGNPSLVAIAGPMFNPTSIGGLTAWKILVTGAVLAALMSLLTVVRHTRLEEETGRLELVGAGIVGRYASLTAALLLVAGANLAIAVLTVLGLVGRGLTLGGSVALAAAIAGAGLMFGAVAALASQLTGNTRTATGIAGAALAGAYLLRALGDPGPTWLSWLSPIGWMIRVRPFAGERWPVLGLAAGLVVVLAGAAYALVGRRDLGAGVLPARPGRAAAAEALRGPFALAWRLQRGVLVGWLFALAFCGATLGGSADGLGRAVGANHQILEMLARMGGRKGLADAYLAAVFGITGVVVAAYAVQATLRLRAEESAGRLEPLLATPVGRVRWALSHLAFALLGTGLLLAVNGAAAGLAYGLQTHDVARQVPRLLTASLVQLPATWVLTGLGVALFGLLPRLATATWAVLVACALLLELGALLRLDQRLVNLSPFTHVPKLPGAVVTLAPLAWLTALAVALTALGLAAFRRRDLA